MKNTIRATALVAVLAAVFAAPALSDPPNGSPAYAPVGHGSLNCGDGSFTEQFYVLGWDQPPGWKLPEFQPPPGAKLLPHAPAVRDARNIVRIDLDNPCSYPVLVYWSSRDGQELTGLVLPHTTVTLGRADLMIAGAWQWDWLGFGAGSCYGGGCYESDYDLLITSDGIALH